MASTTIRLVGEEVDVTLEGDGYPGGRVNVTYWLANPAATPTTVEMTFLLPADDLCGHSQASSRTTVPVFDSIGPPLGRATRICVFQIRTNRLPNLMAGRNPLISECASASISPPGWFVDAGVITWPFED
ncbi:MAG: hypothetical protein SGI90_12835 [Candidatus Eisenbacteria bacterium]|nr:hypothetical protein [Candidatus Eisenbacteria bacterium]